MPDDMTIPDRSAPDRSVTGSGVSRRSVMRTGAHLAWAVPAISLVTAAPSFAASGPAGLPKAAALQTSATVAPTGSGTVVVDGLKNSGGSAIDNASGMFVVPSMLVATGVGKPWQPVGAFAKSSGSAYRVVLLKSVQPGQTAPPIKLHIKKKKKSSKASGKIKYMVSGSGAHVAGSISLKSK